MSATIAAIATPPGVGGLGVIRLSGDDAAAIADRVFSSVSGKSLREMRGYTAAYGTVFNENGRIDDAVALVFTAPKSYTGENVVELSCHGGVYLLQKVLSALYAAGAVPAQPGEFTRRAFLNGKMTLTQREKTRCPGALAVGRIHPRTARHRTRCRYRRPASQRSSCL